VKGFTSYFHQSQSATSEWMSFASSMAASVMDKMLKDAKVIRKWPHCNQDYWNSASQDDLDIGFL